MRAQKSNSLYGLPNSSPAFGSLPRRSQRAHQSGEEEEADETNEEDVTRCVCGLPTYEGPPGSEAFEGVTVQPGQLNEDLGDMFIQCDGCGVWQHGGCVGIIEDDQTPDKYYCECCKPKMHTLKWDSTGYVLSPRPLLLSLVAVVCWHMRLPLCEQSSKQSYPRRFHSFPSKMARYHSAPQRAAADQAEHRRQYSLWVPLHPQFARKSSTSKSDDRSKRERENTVGRASADPVTGRRRGTMRSKEHDDEEEQLQRALEESKKVNEPSGGKRNGKRSRDDSEE
nr:putative histone deacetylase complex subunit cti6 [Quercus suber]